MPNIDIIKDIAERETQISKLQDEVAALRKVAEIYGLRNGSAITVVEKERNLNNFTPTMQATEANGSDQKKPFGGSKFAIPVGDASAKVLENEKNGMHLDKILEKIAELGATPTRTSLDAALRKDSKKRFKLLGKRIWTLNDMRS